MTCRAFERERVAGQAPTLQAAQHLVMCPSCRAFEAVSRQVVQALPRLGEPAVPASFDTYLAQRVLAATGRQQKSPRGSFWNAVPAVPTALRYALVASPLAALLVSLAATGKVGLHLGGMTDPLWPVMASTVTSQCMSVCVAFLIGLVLLLACEQGRAVLVRFGLVSVSEPPPVPVDHRPVRCTGNPIYDRYLSMWGRGGHVLGPVPGVLLGCMTVAAPLVLYYSLPVLAIAVFLLWAVGQGVPRGYFTVSSERHAGTNELVALSGMSAREAAVGYLLASVAPTLVELVGGACLLGCLTVAGLMPAVVAVTTVLLAVTLALWASALGMSLAGLLQGGRRPLQWVAVSLLSVCALVVACMWKYRASPMLGMDAAYAGWTALMAASAILYLSLGVILFNTFQQNWGMATDGTVPEAVPVPALSVHPWLRGSMPLRLYLRSWKRQLLPGALVLLPVLAAGPVRGMPVTMLIFLLWGFVQAFKVMDREQHRATMALLMVTPRSPAAMFGSQIVTAVLPLLLPWALHCALAVTLDPKLVGAVITVGLLSLLLGVTGSALGLLNRYAIYLDFQRSPRQAL